MTEKSYASSKKDIAHETDEFIERVHQVHAITKYEKEYELAIELAKVVLG